MEIQTWTFLLGWALGILQGFAFYKMFLKK
jgi:hypothetical protein